MKRLLLIPLLLFTLVGAKCPANTQSIVKNARDTSAGLIGALEQAQSKYLDSCKADNTQQVCKTINKSGSAENLLVTSLEGYCGWAVGTTLPDDTTPCVPVESAAGALKAAMDNATQALADIKGVLQ